MSFAALVGCSGKEEGRIPEPLDPKALEAAVQRGTGIEPSVYAGELSMKVPVNLPSEQEPVPVVLYAGLSGQTETRLAMNGFLDLRSVQARLPARVSGVLHETCKHELALKLDDLFADGDSVRASGTVRAKLFSCNRRDPENEKQGFRWLTQDVDIEATARADVVGQCIRFSLVDLELDPRGLLGGIANLFGVSDLARRVVLEEAEAFLNENRVCPDLPAELGPLQPDLTSGGVREIGDRGIGAELSGSVDTSASTLISLLAVVEQRDIVEGDE